MQDSFCAVRQTFLCEKLRRSTVGKISHFWTSETTNLFLFFSFLFSGANDARRLKRENSRVKDASSRRELVRGKWFICVRWLLTWKVRSAQHSEWYIVYTWISTHRRVSHHWISHACSDSLSSVFLLSRPAASDLPSGPVAHASPFPENRALVDALLRSIAFFPSLRPLSRNVTAIENRVQRRKKHRSRSSVITEPFDRLFPFFLFFLFL